MKSYLKVLYQPLLGLLLVLFLTTALSSCEDHEPIDPNVHIGYVLCDDHSCMDTTTYFKPVKKEKPLALCLQSRQKNIRHLLLCSRR